MKTLEQPINKSTQPILVGRFTEGIPRRIPPTPPGGPKNSVGDDRYIMPKLKNRLQFVWLDSPHNVPPQQIVTHNFFCKKKYFSLSFSAVIIVSTQSQCWPSKREGRGAGGGRDFGVDVWWAFFQILFFLALVQHLALSFFFFLGQCDMKKKSSFFLKINEIIFWTKERPFTSVKGLFIYIEKQSVATVIF